ncbi:hypothetical protein LEMLEM_LOCUS17375 [Lemmus lemmus]
MSSVWKMFRSEVPAYWAPENSFRGGASQMS